MLVDVLVKSVKNKRDIFNKCYHCEERRAPHLCIGGGAGNPLDK